MIKSDAKGSVFGSVTAADIEKRLLVLNYAEAKVILEKPLRALGDHQVEVVFDHGVRVKTTVRVRS